MAGNTISVVRGDTKDLDVVFKDSTGSAIDITGFSIWFTVKSAIEDLDTNAKIQLINTSHTSPTNGSTTFSIGSDLTSGLREVSYLYDIQYVNDTGTSKKSTSRGNFVVTNDVTLA